MTTHLNNHPKLEDDLAHMHLRGSPSQIWDWLWGSLYTVYLAYLMLHKPTLHKRRPIRSEICFSTVVSAHALRAGQTKEMVQIHQTLFLRER